jgi:hypothetical protein
MRNRTNLRPVALPTRWRISVLPSTPLPAPVSAVVGGDLGCSGAAGAKMQSSKWRLAMHWGVSRCLLT